MSKMNIGAKIRAGFFIAIAFLLLISVISIITNVLSYNNVNDVRADADLQTMSKDLGNTFQFANTYAQEIYLTTNDEAYRQFTDYINQGNELIKTMEDIVAQNSNLSKYADNINIAKSDYEQFKSFIDQVNSSNLLLEAAVVKAKEDTAVLILAGDSAYQNQQTLWRNESALDIEYSEKIRRADRLDSTIEFYKDIIDLVNSGNLMLNTFDSDGYNDFVNAANDVLKLHQDYIDSAKNQSTKDSAQVTIDALKPYMSTIGDFNSANITNKNAINVSKAHSDSATANFDDFFAEIDKSIETGIKNTENASIQSLVFAVIASVIAVIASFIVSSIIISIITKPLNRMKNNLVKIGTTGNMTLSPEELKSAKEDANAKDEVGECVAAYLTLVNHLEKIGNEIDIVSTGDLTVNFDVLSREDVIGNAVTRLVDRLNDIFREFGLSTNQLAMNSNHISAGSQSLAQGSTEQAASIEELSSSIGEVADSTKLNTNKALTASKLAETIKSNAEAGSVRMESMVKAVNEINDASQEISKVIKAIDDIAFQTNILALNAAVEAARAGVHGKGFAVVADEVRNLAAKSADAAKSTGELIENSMQKASFGSQIAIETSESFKEIVEGIKQSSIIISEIADASYKQNKSVEQINQSIDQVAQVVQQNSATAEESAAAAEELSGQSNNLDMLVGQYKLKK